MADLFVPSRSPIALALREPNLLVPGRKPVGAVEIDWSHPLLRNARYVVTDKGGKLYVSYRGEIEFPAITGSITLVRGHPALATADSRYSTQALGSDWRNNGTLAWAGWWNGTWYGANFARMMAFGALDLIYSSSGDWLVTTFAGGTTTPAVVGDQAWVIRQTGGFEGDSVLMVNGDTVASGTSSLSFTNANTNIVWFNDDTTGRYTQFGLGIAVVLDRYWSDDESRSFSADPYQILKPANDAPYLFSVGGGGATTLVVANASHGHAVDSPALTQQNTLAAADSTHAHAAEAPTLTVLYSLAPADASHAHAADNADLAQQSTLAVAESTHAHTAESPALTQAHLLAVSDSAHGHLVDNVVLVTAGALGVQDATHAHSAESPSLAQAATIAPQDAAHSHTADSPALVQASTVVVQDATHGHAADNLTLSLSTLLEVARSTHAHSADAVALTQAHLLAVADALHAHLAETPTLVQAGTLIVSDALHAHLADNVGLIEGELILPGGQRIYLVRADRRVHLVASERRLHLIN